MTLLLAAAGHGQTELPKEVQADLLLVRIDTALKERKPWQASRLVSELRALDAPLAIGQLVLVAARVSLANDDFVAATDQLAAFLASAERGSDAYRAALTMMSQIDAQRQHRLARLKTDANIAELKGDFEAARSNLTTLLSQTPRDSAGYPEALDLLAGWEGRRDAFARRKQAEQAARDTHLQELEEKFQAEQAAKTGELALEETYSGHRDAVLHLRHILNATYNPARSKPVLVADGILDRERIWLAKYVQEQGLAEGRHPVALRYVSRDVLDHAATQGFAPYDPYNETFPGLVRFDDWAAFKGSKVSGPTYCWAVSFTQNIGPKPEYLPMAVMFGMEEEGARKVLLAVAPTLRSDRPVRASVDQRAFSVALEGIGLRIPEDASMTRAMRRGAILRIEATSAASDRPVVVTYSLKGFTKAFEEAARLCNRRDTLSWIK